MASTIPSVFCHLKAFSDGKAQKGMILQARHESNKIHLTARPAPVCDIHTTCGLTLQEDSEASPPTPFEATFVCCGSEIRTRAWYTKIQVFFRPLYAWIPILEFETPPRLPALHVFPLEGDTAETCAQRIQDLQRLRAQVLSPPRPTVHHDPLYYHPDAVPLLQSQDEPDLLFFTEVPPPPALRLPPPPPPPRAPSPKPPGFVPRFVAELIKREAISKGDTCAITMASVAECERPTMTSCFHIFEGAALEAWLRNHTACPSCRQPVTDVMEI